MSVTQKPLWPSRNLLAKSAGKEGPQNQNIVRCHGRVRPEIMALGV
jgi:hypothetical protein